MELSGTDYYQIITHNLVADKACSHGEEEEDLTSRIE